MLEALISQFAQIEDPRCDWRVEHKLLDILVIAVCAVIGEAESFEDIALYGRCKRDWLHASSSCGIRRTELALMPTAAAMAPAVQGVASCGGSVGVSSTTRSIVACAKGGTRDGLDCRARARARPRA